jgi:2-polyprenyl-6-methoxyphenol hydroxylase-like FAD-dependent oxidoreductase
MRKVKSHTMNRVQKILIVGGGVAGLTAAVALCRAGCEVEVVELNPKWSVYGVGIIQQGNALRAFDTLGLAGKCIAAGHPMGAVRFYDHLGHFRFEVPQPAMAGPKYPPGNGLTRPRLHTILQEAVREAGANIRLGLTVSTLAQSDEAVMVTFSDGTFAQYDLVVGADGLRSLIRNLVFGSEHQPAYVGQVCWRCNVPRLPEVTTGWLFEGGKLGKAGFIPLAPDLMYILLVETPRPGLPPRFSEDQLAKAYHERLAEFGGPVAEVRDNYITDASEVVYRPFETLLLPPPWYRGRVVLIGDAAHSMTAHVAQGAAMAVEDGVVLAEEIATQDPLPVALDRFMRRRYERCKILVDISSQLSQWERDRVVDADVEGLTRKSFEIAAMPI